MTINITVLVQILHFFIAYVILERLFFRYAARILTKRDAIARDELESLEGQKRSLEVAQTLSLEQQQKFQQSLKKKIPSIEHIKPMNLEDLQVDKIELKNGSLKDLKDVLKDQVIDAVLS